MAVNAISPQAPTTPGAVAETASSAAKAAKDIPNATAENTIGGDNWQKIKSTFSKSEMRSTFADEYESQQAMELDIMRMKDLTNMMKSYLEAAKSVSEVVR